MGSRLRGNEGEDGVPDLAKRIGDIALAQQFSEYGKKVEVSLSFIRRGDLTSELFVGIRCEGRLWTVGWKLGAGRAW